MGSAAAIPDTVIAVIGETFSVAPSHLSRSTTAADVDGWDSLAHTVLMVRLEKRLGMRIAESIAAKAVSVGELIDLICAEAGREGTA